MIKIPDIATVDLITTLITINGVLLGFLSTTLSNVLSIDSKPIIQKMKEAKAESKETRYERLLKRIESARNLHMIALIVGITMIPFIKFNNDEWMKIIFFVFLIYEIYTIWKFHKANSLLDLTLRN